MIVIPKTLHSNKITHEKIYTTLRRLEIPIHILATEYLATKLENLANVTSH